MRDSDIVIGEAKTHPITCPDLLAPEVDGRYLCITFRLPRHLLKVALPLSVLIMGASKTGFTEIYQDIFWIRQAASMTWIQFLYEVDVIPLKIWELLMLTTLEVTLDRRSLRRLDVGSFLAILGGLCQRHATAQQCPCGKMWLVDVVTKPPSGMAPMRTPPSYSTSWALSVLDYAKSLLALSQQLPPPMAGAGPAATAPRAITLAGPSSLSAAEAASSV